MTGKSPVLPAPGPDDVIYTVGLSGSTLRKQVVVYQPCTLALVVPNCGKTWCTDRRERLHRHHRLNYGSFRCGVCTSDRGEPTEGDDVRGGDLDASLTILISSYPRLCVCSSGASDRRRVVENSFYSR